MNDIPCSLVKFPVGNEARRSWVDARWVEAACVRNRECQTHKSRLRVEQIRECQKHKSRLRLKERVPTRQPTACGTSWANKTGWLRFFRFRYCRFDKMSPPACV
jgi:hypothetical protein